MKLNLAAAFGIAVSAMFATPAVAQAQVSLDGAPADEMVEARAIIETIYPLDKRDEMFSGMVDEIGSQFAAGALNDPVFEEPGIKAIMDDFFASLSGRLMPVIRKHMPAMMEANAVAYTRQFSLEELKEIRAFAETPTGGRYFGTVTELLGHPAVAQANRAYLADVQTLQRSTGEELRNEVVEYLEANPEVAKRLEARSKAAQ